MAKIILIFRLTSDVLKELLHSEIDIAKDLLVHLYCIYKRGKNNRQKMMLYTHFVISLFFIMLFFSSVNSPVLFVTVALIATLLPDIDNAYSSVGKHKIFKSLQILFKHRGFIHSFTFLIIISALFAIFLPIIAFPFFLGYSLHLLEDSFTKEGITPFWPYNRKSSWHFRTGGVTETTVFISFIILDIIAIVFIILK